MHSFPAEGARTRGQGQESDETDNTGAESKEECYRIKNSFRELLRAREKSHK